MDFGLCPFKVALMTSFNGKLVVTKKVTDVIQLSKFQKVTFKPHPCKTRNNPIRNTWEKHVESCQ